MAPTVTSRNNGSNTDYKIEGTPQEVQDRIDELMESYDYRGYNTTVTYDFTDENGVRKVVINRWNSCD